MTTTCSKCRRIIVLPDPASDWEREVTSRLMLMIVCDECSPPPAPDAAVPASNPFPPTSWAARSNPTP